MRCDRRMPRKRPPEARRRTRSEAQRRRSHRKVLDGEQRRIPQPGKYSEKVTKP